MHETYTVIGTPLITFPSWSTLHSSFQNRLLSRVQPRPTEIPSSDSVSWSIRRARTHARRRIVHENIVIMQTAASPRRDSLRRHPPGHPHRSAKARHFPSSRYRLRGADAKRAQRCREARPPAHLHRGRHVSPAAPTPTVTARRAGGWRRASLAGAQREPLAAVRVRPRRYAADTASHLPRCGPIRANAMRYVHSPPRATRRPSRSHIGGATRHTPRTRRTGTNSV